MLPSRGAMARAGKLTVVAMNVLVWSVAHQQFASRANQLTDRGAPMIAHGIICGATARRSSAAGSPRRLYGSANGDIYSLFLSDAGHQRNAGRPVGSPARSSWIIRSGVGDAYRRLAATAEAESQHAEAEQHHRSGRGLGNGCGDRQRSDRSAVARSAARIEHIVD